MNGNSSDSSSRAAFEYPNFRFYMLARFLAAISSEMQSVAVGWQVYELTHRPPDLGLVGMTQFVPGHTADRIARQKIANEVGQFESGITAQWFGTVPAVVLGGVEPS